MLSTKREEKLIELLCEWNMKKWEGRENKLIYAMWNIYLRECLARWNNELTA